LIYLCLKRVDDIMTQHLEVRVPHEVCEVGLTPGEIVVQAKNLMPLIQ
jgi:hypothetical protein